MAKYKETLTGEHKKGFFRGMFSAGTKMGLLGAGLVAVATGGFALPLMAAAFIGVGAIGSIYSAVRFGKESALNMTIGRPRLNANKIEMAGEGEHQQREPGQGLAGLVTGLLGAGMAGQTIWDKLRGGRGGRGGVDTGTVDTVADNHEAVIEKYGLRKGEGKDAYYEVTAEQLAIKEVREALEARADVVKDYRKGASVAERSALNEAARESIDTGNPDRIVFTDAQLLNRDNRDTVLDLGSNVERQFKRIDRQISAFERGIEADLKIEERQLDKGRTERADETRAHIEQLEQRIDVLGDKRAEIIESLRGHATPAAPAAAVVSGVSGPEPEGPTPTAPTPKAPEASATPATNGSSREASVPNQAELLEEFNRSMQDAGAEHRGAAQTAKAGQAARPVDGKSQGAALGDS